MKTIRQWLEELPEPYRSEALENASHRRLILFMPTKRDALSESFDWEKSPQGYDYWHALNRTL